ncbi:MAG: hypothetical protein ACRDWE_04190 [Acidimicrobiales bacterium]
MRRRRSAAPEGPGEAITKDDYDRALADGMEREVQRYRRRLHLPDNTGFG